MVVRRMVLVVAVLLAASLPVAGAHASEDGSAGPAAVEAITDAPTEEPPAAPEPAPEEPVTAVEGPAASPVDAPAIESPEAGETPEIVDASPDVESPEAVEATEPPAEVPAAEESQPGDEGGPAPEAAAEPVEDADAAPVAATTEEAVEADADEAAALSQAVDPANVVVVEFDAEGFCEVAFGSDGAEQASVQVAPAVSQAAAVPYGDLVAQVDAVLAGYPDAMLVSATYDGSTLIVVLIPDLSVCDGIEEGELPVPVDDLADVEVIAEVMPDEDVCLLLEDGFGEVLVPPSIDDLLDALDDEEIASFVEARFGPDLSPEELAALVGFSGALDPVLAGTPGGWVDVSYDGAVLFVYVTPDPATVDCGEEQVVAQPISRPVSPAGGGGGTAAPAVSGGAGGSGGARLAATGFDTPGAAAVGLVVVLLGAALVRSAGRGRYRGTHLTS